MQTSRSWGAKRETISSFNQATKALAAFKWLVCSAGPSAGCGQNIQDGCLDGANKAEAIVLCAMNTKSRWGGDVAGMAAGLTF